MLFNNLESGIYVIHENNDWMPPFREAFARKGVTLHELHLTSGGIDVDSAPPEGVFWNRLSASSHTREHGYAKEFGRAALAWLESYNRRVINGSPVLEFEVSKVRQYLALKKAGFRTPKTIAIFDKADLLSEAKKLKTPFITKHNQGGKGLGVRLFESHEEFESYINSSDFEEAVDGITLLQEYIKAKEPFITRAEFIGGRFHYAIAVDISAGSFELCPADACNIEDSTSVIASAVCGLDNNKFRLRDSINASNPLIQRLEGFLRTHSIEIAGIEFIENDEVVIYDINTNTNYNKAVEDSVRNSGGIPAADRIAEFLIQQYKG